MKFILMLAAVGLIPFVITAHAQEEIEIPYAENPPIIDGKFTSQNEWDYPGFFTNKNLEGNAFEIKITHDQEFIYLLADMVSEQIPALHEDEFTTSAMFCFNSDCISQKLESVNEDEFVIHSNDHWGELSKTYSKNFELKSGFTKSNDEWKSEDDTIIFEFKIPIEYLEAVDLYGLSFEGKLEEIDDHYDFEWPRGKRDATISLLDSKIILQKSVELMQEEPNYTEIYEICFDGECYSKTCFDGECYELCPEGTRMSCNIRLAAEIEYPLEANTIHSISAIYKCPNYCQNIEIFYVTGEKIWRWVSIWDKDFWLEDVIIDDPGGYLEKNPPTFYKNEQVGCTEKDLDGNCEMLHWNGINLKPMVNGNIVLVVGDVDGRIGEATLYLPFSEDYDFDTDGDGLSDSKESELKTNPYKFDTDGDLLSDFEEIEEYGTNSTLADTDGDGLSDGGEVLYFETDPKINEKDESSNTVYTNNPYSLEFQIKDISNIDVENNTFDIDFDLIYSDMVILPNDCLRDLKFKSKANYWNSCRDYSKPLPTLNFYNSLQKPNFLLETNSTNEFGTQFEYKDISGTMKNNFEFKNFPFEKFNFEIIVELPEPIKPHLTEQSDKSEGYDEFYFAHGNLEADLINNPPQRMNILNADNPPKITKRVDFTNTDNYYSRIVYSIEMEKPPIEAFFQIIFPMLLITALGAIIFLLDIEKLTKIELGAIFLTSFVFFTQLVQLENTHITYFTLFDYITRFCYVIFIIVIVSPAIQMKMKRGKEDQSHIRQIDKIAMIALIITAIVGSLLIFQFSAT